jgi:cell division protein FtsQ
MAKSTKKRAIIYSNVKENKKLAEEKQRQNDNHINLNDEVIIGFNNSGKTNSKKLDPPKKKKNREVTKKSQVKNKKVDRQIQKEKKDNNLEIKVEKKKQSSKQLQASKKVKKPVMQKKQPVAPKMEKRKINPKKQKIVGIAIKIIIALVLLVGIVIFLLNCELFNIKEIVVKIENSNVVTESQVLEYSNIKVGQNLFRINKNDIKEQIQKNNYIDSVKIKRELPNKVIIEATERKIRFQFEKAEQEKKYIYIDDKGVVVDSSAEKKDCICIVGDSTAEYTYGTKVNDSDLQGLSAVLQIQQEADVYGLNDKITKIDISNHSDYIIYFESLGKIAHLGSTSLMNDKMARIKKILDIESEYEGVIYVNVDLNNGEYPYFRENV